MPEHEHEVDEWQMVKRSASSDRLSCIPLTIAMPKKKKTDAAGWQTVERRRSATLEADRSREAGAVQPSGGAYRALAKQSGKKKRRNKDNMDCIDNVDVDVVDEDTPAPAAGEEGYFFIPSFIQSAFAAVY